jgi:hypothetical protein
VRPTGTDGWLIGVLYLGNGEHTVTFELLTGVAPDLALGIRRERRPVSVAEREDGTVRAGPALESRTPIYPGEGLAISTQSPLYSV